MLEVDIETSHVWKGAVGKNAVVVTTGDTCGFKFHEGERYLVLSSQAKKWPHFVSLCSPSKPLKNVFYDEWQWLFANHNSEGRTQKLEEIPPYCVPSVIFNLKTQLQEPLKETFQTSFADKFWISRRLRRCYEKQAPKRLSVMVSAELSPRLRGTLSNLRLKNPLNLADFEQCVWNALSNVTVTRGEFPPRDIKVDFSLSFSCAKFGSAAR
ncbi:MAG: hypothetical protein AB7G93_20760 [Bdellovibrionales bacterium]